MARHKKRLPLYKTTEGTSSVRGKGLLGDSSPDVWERQEQERSSFVCVGMLVRASQIEPSFVVRLICVCGSHGASVAI
jgi:hypothetical protein